MFHNIYARHPMEKGHPVKRFRLHCANVEGGDAKAKVVVMRLVEELGFDRVDAGGLDDSWPQLPSTSVHSTNFNSEGVRSTVTETSRKRRPEFQATDESPGTYAKPT